jgi:hypothetical protein
MWTAKNRGVSAISELWTSAFESAGSHLSAGWFWLFPLLFAIHHAEEATSVWMKGSLHNSISYTTLDVPQVMQINKRGQRMTAIGEPLRPSVRPSIRAISAPTSAARFSKLSGQLSAQDWSCL